MGPTETIQSRKELVLRPDLLYDRLDHEMSISQIRELGRKTETTPSRVTVGRREFPPLYRPVERFPDSAPAGLDQVVTDLSHDDVEARLHRDFGDPAAHEPASDYAYLLDIHD